MSIQAMSWIFDHSRAEGIDRLVLLVLANHYNRETGQCDPGYRRIAAEAGVARGTVGNAVARLVELGELEIVSAGAGRRTSFYHFPWLDRYSPEPRSSVQDVDARQNLASTESPLASTDPPVSVHPGGQIPKTEPEPRGAAFRGGAGGSKNPYDSLPSAREIAARQNLSERADPDQQATGLAAARDALAVARSKTRPTVPDPALELEAEA